MKPKHAYDERFQESSDELTRLSSCTPLPNIKDFLKKSAEFLLAKTIPVNNITLVSNSDYQHLLDEEILGEHYKRLIIENYQKQTQNDYVRLFVNLLNDQVSEFVATKLELEIEDNTGRFHKAVPVSS